MPTGFYNFEKQHSINILEKYCIATDCGDWGTSFLIKVFDDFRNYIKKPSYHPN